MLNLEQVSVEIDGRRLVDRVSLSLHRGELLGLIGPNGAGKSSLLKALAHLLPYQGEIRLDGELLSSLSPRQRALRCAYLGQGDQSSWPLRLRDYVALGRLPTSVTTDPSVIPLRELAYLPAGEMDPHGVPADAPRAGKLPEQVLETLAAGKPAAQTPDQGAQS